ncbi:hypothetical protein [Gluconobacter sphaericus]|uniref:hypothetical protein n=1 Tax=Gluconobacter sphaericus TaxID=574987 RepID=UPI0038D088A9
MRKRPDEQFCEEVFSRRPRSVGAVGSGACGREFVAFFIDVLARYIVGWRVSRTAHAGFELDTMEYDTLECFDWFNNLRILELISNVTRAKDK